MKLGTELLTARQRIRHYEDTERDRAFFHRQNSDPAILRFFPYSWTRAEADERYMEMLARRNARGAGWAVAEMRDTGEIVGYVGVAPTRIPEVIGDVFEIGWRYVPEAWGKGLATEAALRLRDHAFDEIGVPVLYAVAMKDNEASLRVMQRIGMTYVEDGDFDHPFVPDHRPELKLHVTYRMRADDPRRIPTGAP
jgi:Acetyltransferases, including N-acetylases of ribosomal proteins